MFNLTSSYIPTGDQPQAIDKLTEYVLSGNQNQVLLGVTGSGKTFTIANVIKNVQKPTLIISHNKTLAAQLYQEFRDYFPSNAVEYFVSYYDYYQPESYIPSTDTYIEKDADINQEIDKLRLSATNSLLTRKDVIVVASVSCIYNLGSPVEYMKTSLDLRVGMKFRLADLQQRLAQLYYDRSDYEFKRGTYRIRGEYLDIYPSYQDFGVRLDLVDDKLVGLSYFDTVSGNTIEPQFSAAEKKGKDFFVLFPAKHYITPELRRDAAIKQIELDLVEQVKNLRENKKELEAYRLEQRTNYDLEMIKEIGYCKGIENYSRYFDGRKPGESPYTLIDFFPKDFLTVIDESHITVPQIRGMYNGDQARKKVLIDYGFRLPSAIDNRPLKFEEFLRKSHQFLYNSATPGDWEISLAEGKVVQQLIRPTGIIDPKVTVLPTKGQVDDLIKKIEERVINKQRVLVTTLTKRMAEELSGYLIEKGIKAAYLHSDVETLERSDILDDLRKGNYDVLIGINLLREGLDLPEVSLVAILDADKEGFLRSDTSLIQTMGRAARHLQGEVVMYADNITDSMRRAMQEVERRREIQTKYNLDHGIVPSGIIKPIRERLIEKAAEELVSVGKKGVDIELDYGTMAPSELKKEVKRLEEEMKYEAETLNFEKAALLRDEIKKIKRFI